MYKGFLSDGQIVAVKRLRKKEKEEKEERIGDFLTELGIIAHIDHPNAAKLLGFGVDGGFHLVLQFSPHGSLASMLFGKLARIIYLMFVSYFMSLQLNYDTSLSRKKYDYV